MSSHTIESFAALGAVHGPASDTDIALALPLSAPNAGLKLLVAASAQRQCHHMHICRPQIKDSAGEAVTSRQQLSTDREEMHGKEVSAEKRTPDILKQKSLKFETLRHIAK